MSPPVIFMVALFMTIALAGAFTGAALLDNASASQVRLERATDNLDYLLNVQLGEEAGLRGFLASGQREFLLTEDDNPEADFADHAARLETELRRSNLRDDERQVELLERQHLRWHREVEHPLLARPQGSDALARERRGNAITGAMEAIVRVVRADIRAADLAVTQQLRFRINAVVAGSAGAIGLFSIVILVLVLSRARAVAALSREQSLVAALQQTLRVERVPLTGTHAGYAYTSATREALVGGDVADTWQADAGHGWFLIADASGKGIEAARHSAFVQYAVRTLTAEFDDPADVVAHLNRLFLATFDDPFIFVVLLLGVLDARTSTVRYASAGHDIAFVRRRDAGVEQLEPTGSIVGLDANQAFSTRTLRLDPGDTLVLATDALTESRDPLGNLLGNDGVAAMLQASGEAEPQALCDLLVGETQRRSQGEVHDDLAILVLRLSGVEATATARR